MAPLEGRGRRGGRQAKRARHRTSKRPRRRRWPAVGGLALVVAAAAAGNALRHHLDVGATGSSGPGAASGPGTGGPPATTTPPPPLTITAITPAPGAADLPATPTLTVALSTPLAPSSPMPSLSPSVPGSWQRDGRTLEFRAAGQLVPGTSFTLDVPGGPGGVVGAGGQHLTSSTSARFRVRPGSTLRLQELLAELGYLPVSFTPGAALTSATLPGPVPTSAAAIGAEATSPVEVSLDPLPGTFAWRFPHIPAPLAAGWQPGAWNVVTKGAVMAFEADHGLADDGIAGPLVWGDLLKAVAARQATIRPYDELIATETEPETLYVWQNGDVVAQSPTNSGVAGAPTELGTFPVYARYASTTMAGTNPDGSRYDDPGVPYVAYFNGGDAVHGFVRAGYGYPQSDGCLELPMANAPGIFDDDPIGTLVTVTTGDLSAELGAAPSSYAGAAP